MGNKLKFNVYRKPTTTDTVIHNNSRQSWKIKMSPFHSLIHRLLNFPLSTEDYNRELNTIKQIARNNGYRESLIDNMIKNKNRKILKKQFYHGNHPKSKNFKLLNYVPRISDNISNKLRKLDCNPISVNKTNLGKLLVNNKNNITKLHHSGVYRINCQNCEAVYIGQTGRNLEKD